MKDKTISSSKRFSNSSQRSLEYDRTFQSLGLID